MIGVQGGSYEDIKNLDTEQNNNTTNTASPVKHKSSSIFIKNLHPCVSKEELLGLVSKYPGYQVLGTLLSFSIVASFCKNS